MKALKIDVTSQTVYEVEIKDWRGIAPLIGNGCTLFCVPYDFSNKDGLYSDDEGLLQEKMIGAFKFSFWDVPLVGNAIILGTDEDGESIDYKSNMEKIASLISWFSPEFSEIYKGGAMEEPFKFYSL